MNECLPSVLGIQTYTELQSLVLVEFYESKMTALKEFSLFCKLFTPDRDFPLGEANALLFKEQWDFVAQETDTPPLKIFHLFFYVKNKYNDVNTFF